MKSENDWNNRYLNDDTPWDLGGATPALQHLFNQSNSPLDNTQNEGKRKRVLVPGCGSGYDAAFLTDKGFHVLAVDIAEEPLKTLEKLAQKIPQTDRGYLRWKQTDFFEPHFQNSIKGKYDYIWEYTSLVALSHQFRKQYVNFLKRTLKPDGTLFGLMFPIVKNEELPPSDKGPPYALTIDVIKGLFENDFHCTFQDPGPSHPKRQGREILMIARKK